MPRKYDMGQRAAPRPRSGHGSLPRPWRSIADRGLAGRLEPGDRAGRGRRPATVRNHFPEPGDLAKAVFEGLLAELRDPDDGDLRRRRWPPDRVTRLAESLADFYERGEPWWRAYEREPELIQAWGGGVDQYYADIERPDAAALGDLATDDRSVAVVASVIGPPTFFALRGRGLSSDEAVASAWSSRSPGSSGAAKSWPHLDQSCNIDGELPPGGRDGQAAHLPGLVGQAGEAAAGADARSRRRRQVEPWTTSFNPGTTTLERLLELAREVDFAVFVFARDDWTTTRAARSPPPGDPARPRHATTSSSRPACSVRPSACAARSSSMPAARSSRPISSA